MALVDTSGQRIESEEKERTSMGKVTKADSDVLARCPIEPEGAKVVIAPDQLDDRTSGGIFIPAQSKRMEQNAVTSGTLARIGPDAEINYYDPKEDSHRPAQVGDRIIFARHGGVEIRWGKDRWRILTDGDVVALMTAELPHQDDYAFRTI